ncbi:MAG: twin-arginine translocase TatA/TatE family subunit [Bacteroidales bacterium]|nr:twin-arginine translocase TatA/TatE family subunit [Bacteroidales bacterium]
MDNFLLFFNISGGEILVIIAVVYLVFGPKKIPEFARMIGKGLNELRRATQDIRDEITREANKIKDDVNLDIKDPFGEKKAAENKTTGKESQPEAKPEGQKNDVKPDQEIDR